MIKCIFKEDKIVTIQAPTAWNTIVYSIPVGSIEECKNSIIELVYAIAPNENSMIGSSRIINNNLFYNINNTANSIGNIQSYTIFQASVPFYRPVKVFIKINSQGLAESCLWSTVGVTTPCIGRITSTSAAPTLTPSVTNDINNILFGFSNGDDPELLSDILYFRAYIYKMD